MQGIHHLGFSVLNVEASSWFFCELLGWQVIRRVDEYPAIFVSDESVMFSLWQTLPGARPFDRRNNVGLHHVALQVDSETELFAIYEKLRSVNSVAFEFGPELLREGPAKHMICYDPSGIRVEFIWVPEIL